DGHVTGVQTCALPIFRAKSLEVRITSQTTCILLVCEVIRTSSDFARMIVLSFTVPDSWIESASNSPEISPCEVICPTFTMPWTEIGRASCRERVEVMV